MDPRASRFITRSISICACVAVTACERGSDAGAGGGVTPSDQNPVVYVVNYPLKYFVERIGSQAVSVEFPAPAGKDPAYWKPDAATIISYQKADLIFLNGGDYAKWVEHATLPKAKLVDTSARSKDRIMIVEDAVTHSHGPEGDHSHAGPAFTTWLDLTLAVEQARAVRDALVGLRPDNTEMFEAGFASLEKDLVEIDGKLAEVFGRKPGQPLLASHPVYQYLERRYSLNLKSLHWEPDEMPDEAMWISLAEMLKFHPATWMIWEGQPLDRVVARLKTLGVGAVVVSPCSNVPEKGDFLGVMGENLTNLERAFSGSE